MTRLSIVVDICFIGVRHILGWSIIKIHSYCKAYPSLAKNGNNKSVLAVGTDKFRIEPGRSHDLSGLYKTCAIQYLRDKTTVVPKAQPRKIIMLS